MSELEQGAPRDTFVPASFADLRRNDRAEGEALERSREAKMRTREDFADLVGDGGFMRQSKWIAIGGVVIAAVLILAVYYKPLFETAYAVQTASSVAGQGIQSKLGGVGAIAGQVSAIRTIDMKAIDTAKGGMACLNGQASCAGGARSPFK